MPKDKLKPGFDPVWQSDLLDLRQMSSKAFILRQMYRSYRNPETNICTLSEYQIQAITGWNRQTIRRAKHQLFSLGEIVPRGSFSFLVKPFHQFKDQKTGQELSCLENTPQDKNCPTIGQKLSYQQDNNCPKVGQKLSPPNNTDTDNTDTDSGLSSSSVEKPVNKHEGKICGNCQNYDREHLDTRGNKDGYCPILKMSCPPSLNAALCINFNKPEQPAQPAESEV